MPVEGVGGGAEKKRPSLATVGRGDKAIKNQKDTRGWVEANRVSYL